MIQLGLLQALKKLMIYSEWSTHHRIKHFSNFISPLFIWYNTGKGQEGTILLETIAPGHTLHYCCYGPFDYFRFARQLPHICVSVIKLTSLSTVSNLQVYLFSKMISNKNIFEISHINKPAFLQGSTRFTFELCFCTRKVK